ncbi:hypothetical protein AMTRI_Chr13g85260 [Amborella trichopoda]
MEETESTRKPNSSRNGGRRARGRIGKGAPYGISRRSILKKSFSQEQVVFTAPLSDEPHVAIIGGGMTGLICALTLEQRGIRSTVFDTEASAAAFESAAL